MNPADQIASVARRAARAVSAAVDDHHRRRPATEPVDPSGPDERLRRHLDSDADALDFSTPQLLLPADHAASSPHSRDAASPPRGARAWGH